MKNNCRNIGPAPTKRFFRFVQAKLRILSLAATGFALMTCAVSGIVAKTASASPELDHVYALETIGFLRAWDNVDGLFGDYVSNTYRDYFSHQSRFVWIDLSKADSALTKSKLPYAKVIDDTEILGQLARSLRAESVIRTKILKEGSEYQFTLEWLHSPQMEIMATETFTLKENSDGGHSDGGGPALAGLGDVRTELAHGLDRLMAKVPFLGHVTGRDNSAVTVNIGAYSGVKRGDTLVIGTLDEVKKHPLLHAIVDWQITRIGKVVVDQVDEALTFGHVIEEEPGRQIARYQKISQVIAAPPPPDAVEKPVQTNALEETPHLGWVSGGLDVGSLSRQYSSYTSLTSTSLRSGSGTSIGGSARGQVWLNREVFVEGGVDYQTAGYAQTTAAGTATTPSGASMTVFNWDASLGYTYFLTGDIFGPHGWVKGGFRSTDFTLPVSATDFTSPTSFKSGFIGIGGELPVANRWGAELNLDFGFLTLGSETGAISGTVTGGSSVSFNVGAYYRFLPRITFRLNVGVLADTMSFTANQLSQNSTSIVPSVVFYF